jgi:hypothetical protein
MGSSITVPPASAGLLAVLVALSLQPTRAVIIAANNKEVSFSFIRSFLLHVSPFLFKGIKKTGFDAYQTTCPIKTIRFIN